MGGGLAPVDIGAAPVAWHPPTVTRAGERGHWNRGGGGGGFWVYGERSLSGSCLLRSGTSQPWEGKSLARRAPDVKAQSTGEKRQPRGWVAPSALLWDQAPAWTRVREESLGTCSCAGCRAEHVGAAEAGKGLGGPQLWACPNLQCEPGQAASAHSLPIPEPQLPWEAPRPHPEKPVSRLAVSPNLWPLASRNFPTSPEPPFSRTAPHP